MIKTEAIDKPLYNSRIINTFIKLIKRKYGFVNIDDLLNSAGMESYQIEDEGHWFTQRQVNFFYYKLTEITGNKNIAREAGIYSASPEALGGIGKYILGLVTPAKAYALVGKFTNKFTRSSRYESKEIGPNRVEILVTPDVGVKEERFQCENRLGYIEAISRLFEYKSPQIEHPECLFKGGSVCRYNVSWQPSLSIKWKKIRSLSIPILILLVFISQFLFSPWVAITFFFPFSVSSILFMSWYASILSNRELRSSLEQLEESSDELIDQIDLNYENALMINEIGQVLGEESDIRGILNSISSILEKRLDYDRCLILLADPEKSRLVAESGYGYAIDELDKFMLGSGFQLDRKESKGIFVICFNEQKPFLVNDIEDIKKSLSPRSWEFAQNMEAKAFICCPIIHEDESLGVLAVDNVVSKRPLIQRDINILMGIANQIGVCLHNAKLIDARFRQFQSILQVLVASTEARDPITAGHSEKVTEYAVGMCKGLGLPSDYSDMIRVAASLHDYGKIGVDDIILKKPGRLDNNEYEQIKTHVTKTENILTQVNFEGIYKKVPYIAAAHHEKLDGTGYPNQLTAEDIPFGAKIIAVADVFEALTSRRHYRDPMPINEAFDHLVANIGTHFDKGCVEALINYFNSNARVPYLYSGSFESLNNNNLNSIYFKEKNI